MTIFYLKQNNITEFEFTVCKDYFETSLDQFIDRLAHIKYLCNYYQIDIDELTEIVQKVRVFDTNICCSYCKIAKQIYKPSYIYQHQVFNFICDDCHKFIYSANQRNMQNCSEDLKDDDCPF